MTSGALVESYDYKVFGETRIFDNSGTDITVASNGLGNPYMYHGRRKEENGLYFFRARYLDTVLGRFLQKDPIGDFGDGVSLGNGQSFCLNNPINMIDPMGTEPLTLAAVIWLGVKAGGCFLVHWGPPRIKLGEPMVLKKAPQVKNTIH